MEGIVERKCKNCIFFAPTTKYGGHCQRMPKQAFIEQNIEALPEVRFISGWYQPWMQPDEWCGEFKDKWEVRQTRIEP